MGEFLEDQIKNDKYYYCSKNVRYKKEYIVNIIYTHFPHPTL